MIERDRERAGAAAEESGARGNAGGAGKSYNCPGEDTGYDFEELEEKRI